MAFEDPVTGGQEIAHALKLFFDDILIRGYGPFSKKSYEPEVTRLLRIEILNHFKKRQ